MADHLQCPILRVFGSFHSYLFLLATYHTQYNVMDIQKGDDSSVVVIKFRPTELTLGYIVCLV